MFERIRKRLEQQTTLKLSIYMLRIIGLWPNENEKRFSFYRCCTTLTFICQFIHIGTVASNLIDTRKDVVKFGDNLCMTIAIGLVIYKAYYHQRIKIDVKKLIETVDKLYEQQTQNTSCWKNVAQSYGLERSVVQLAFIAAAFALLISTMFYPFFQRNGDLWALPWPAKYPFQTNGGLNYFFTYIFQIFCLAHLLQTLLWIDNIELTFMDQIAMNLEILGNKFQQIGTQIGGDKNNLKEELGELIKEHLLLISLVEDINELFHPVFLAKALASTSLICLNALTASLAVHDLAALFKSVSNLLTTLLQLFNHCYVGNKANHLSMQIAESIYQSDWYNRSNEFKKDLQFVIMRSQKPMLFTAKPFYVYNFEAFVTIFSGAYSYFTFLRTFSE